MTPRKGHVGAWVGVAVALAGVPGGAAEPVAGGQNPAVGADAVPSLLVLPFEAKAGVSADLAEILSQLLAGNLAKVGRHRVVTFREIENTLSQEQVKQVTGCGSTSCAAEIAGALNTDEIVMGSLGKAGSHYVLVVSRVRARDAQVAGRLSEVFPKLDEDAMVRRIPAMAVELLGVQPVRPAAVPASAPTERAPQVAVAVRPAVPASPPVPPAPEERAAVEFASDPPGATVLVDGDVACPATPCRKEVRLGPRRVSFQKERYAKAEEVVRLERGARVARALRPTFGALVVTTEPAGLAVSLDGKPRGKAPLQLELDPGRYDVRVGGPCHEEVGLPGLEVKAGETRRETLRPRPRSGSLQVRAVDLAGRPVSADVVVDGTRVGSAQGPPVAVPVCGREVAVASRELGTWRSPLAVVERQVTQVEARFNRALPAPVPPAVTPSAPAAKSPSSSRGLSMPAMVLGAGACVAGVAGVVVAAGAVAAGIFVAGVAGADFVMGGRVGVRAIPPWLGLASNGSVVAAGLLGAAALLLWVGAVGAGVGAFLLR
jgi:hypothetical protein